VSVLAYSIYDQAFSTWGLEGNGAIYTLIPHLPQAAKSAVVERYD
jgi:hypothetical protein